MIKALCAIVLAGLTWHACKAQEAFAHAVAMRDCTQEDIPAMAIVLSQQPVAAREVPSGAYIRIEIAWSEWERAQSGELTLIPLSRQEAKDKPVVRAELNLPGKKPEWLTGKLHLTRVTEGSGVTGDYHFSDSSGRQWTGKIDATWIAGRSTCG